MINRSIPTLPKERPAQLIAGTPLAVTMLIGRPFPKQVAMPIQGQDQLNLFYMLAGVFRGTASGTGMYSRTALYGPTLHFSAGKMNKQVQ